MKIAAAFTLCIAATALPTFAQPAKIVPRMTGQTLIDQFLGPPSLKNQALSGRHFIEHQLAQGYLDGIHDATEGTVWCYAGNAKPHTLDYSLVWSLKELSPDALQANAALLVLDFLRKKYPCPNPK